MFFTRAVTNCPTTPGSLLVMHGTTVASSKLSYAMMARIRDGLDCRTKWKYQNGEMNMVIIIVFIEGRRLVRTGFEIQGTRYLARLSSAEPGLVKQLRTAVA